MVSITESLRLNDLATGTRTSTINEPSVAHSTRAILVTGNWYASWSPDAGRTWQHLDPFTLFPATGAGFCCDQLVLYVPKVRLWIWLLQYSENSSGENIVRLAVSRTGGLGPWQWWDLRPTDLSSSWSGQWFDYPDLAVSDDHLWVSLNLFAGNRWTRAVVVRYPLAQLSRAQPVDRRHWSTTSVGSLRFTAGAESTMWFAGTVAHRRQLRLHRWDDADDDVTSWDVPVTAWNDRDYTSACPDGTNWLLRQDDRITGAWRAGGQLGFLWAAGRAAGRPHPFIRGVVLDEESLELVHEPDLWSEQGAWAYPASAPHRRGAVGLAAVFGGPTAFPTFTVGTWDETAAQWRTTPVAASTHSPPDQSWGDYLTVRRHIRRSTSWIASGFSLQGGSSRRHIEPEVVTFRA
ncbi:hypothetical protein [Ornithinimicrobium cryptoxanthini]|uniref:Uncharacterized protein n=1 Tax=Ornithinimicrobium cryptoxanthini TaxID=2934161 RepID=A0ABY4YG80_9MICO|nr:hypothetical protein [Ornithinimicrobium cryptoxanthini]USQ75531.1 hypothetical protein NF557_13040 [Ornithinimicrobium cryptoxanthini]